MLSGGKVLNIIILIMALLGIMLILGKYKETFVPMTIPLERGTYPETEIQGILAGPYQMKKNAGLSDYTYETESKLYPGF